MGCMQGDVKWSVYMTYFRANGLDMTVFLVVLYLVTYASQGTVHLVRRSIGPECVNAMAMFDPWDSLLRFPLG